MRLLCLELLIRFNNKLYWGDTEFCVNTFVVDTGSSPYAIIVGCILFLSSWNIYAILLTAFFFLTLLILIGLSMTGIPKWLKVIPCRLYSVQIELQQNVGWFYFIPFHFHIHVKWKKKWTHNTKIQLRCSFHTEFWHNKTCNECKCAELSNNGREKNVCIFIIKW